MRFLLTLLMLLGPTVASAQVTWEALPNSALSAVAPTPVPPGTTGIGAIVGAWNAGVVDARGRLYIVAAGGHGDYAGNEVYRFDPALARFERLTIPSPAAQWSNPSAEVLLDGTPPSRHIYGGVGYDPAQDAIWLSGGSRWWDGNPTPTSWRFRPTPPTWENLGVTISTSFPGQALSFQTTGNPWIIWDPGMAKLLTVNRWIYAWIDQGANRTVPVACSGIAQGPNGAYNAILDPSTRQLYVVGQGRTRRLDLSVPHNPAVCAGGPIAQDEILPTTGATEIESLYGSSGYSTFGGLGLAWDPVARVVVAYGLNAARTGGRLYTLDPQTRIWQTWEAASLVPPRPSGNGMWSKFWLAGDCLYAVTDTTAPVYRTCTLPWRSTPVPYQVTTGTLGTGIGTVSGAGPYLPGATVTVTAAPAPGSRLSGWSGDVLCPGPFTMPARDVLCIATFDLIPPPMLTLATVGQGAVFGGGAYPPETVVMISASPDAGWAFIGWSGDAVCPGPRQTTVMMPTQAVTCTATFVPRTVPPPVGASWQAVPRPVVRTGTPYLAWTHPDPVIDNGSTLLGGSMKHTRMTWSASLGTLLLTGGDRAGIGDGNGQPSVWATAGDGQWQMLKPPCITDGSPQPARPDTVGWTVDETRNRAVIFPGFYFGEQKALADCPGSNPHQTAYLFNLATRAWQDVPWPPPNTGGYWGDAGASWAVSDPVTDRLCTFSWDGAWGNLFVCLNYATNAWTKMRVGETPYNDSLRNAYASHAQSAIDIQGRAIYSRTLGNRVFRMRLDIAGHNGEWVGQAPSTCLVVDGSDQELYMVFDPDHRALLIPCVPNTGGEVVGMAVYYVDTAKWDYFAAPITGDAVIANVWQWSPACRCAFGTGGHAIFSENPARPGSCTPSTVSPACTKLPAPKVDWRFSLS